MNRLASRATRAIALSTILALVVVALGLTVGVLGYLRGGENVRALDIKRNLARIAQAKETWAVERRVPLGGEVEGGLEALVEGGYLSEMPWTPVRGEWVVRAVGLPPRFEPADDANFRPTLDYSLPDFSRMEIDAAPPQTEQPAEETSPEGAGE